MRMAVLCALVMLSGCATSAPVQAGPAASELSPRAQAFNHYLAGVIHRRNGRFEAAIEDYRKALELEPGSLALLLDLTQLYVRTEEYQQARDTCLRAVNLAPEDPGLWIVFGMIHQRLEDYEGMAAAFQKAIALNPGDALSYEALIVAQQKTNDATGVIDVFEHLVKENPESAKLHYQLGLRLAHINDYENAEKSLIRALELDSSLADARYILAIVYLQTDRNSKAVDEFRAYLDSDPVHPQARENLAGALFRLGQYAEAINILTVLTQEPESEPVHFIERTFALLRAGRYEEARLALPPADAPILSTVLTAWTRKSLGEPFLPVLDSLDKVDGEIDVEVRSYLNELLYLFGTEASPVIAEQLAQMRSAGARSKRLDLILARVLIAMDRREEAKSLLLEGLKTHGPDKWIHFYLAELYDGADQTKLSEKHLLACLEIDPEDPEIMNFLGYLYAEAGVKLKRAEELLKRALQIDKGNPFYLDSLGWVYYRKGQADKAIELIRQAILNMETDDAVLRDHMGDAYLLKGEVDKAVAEWKRAIRLDPSMENASEKIRKHERRK